MKPATLLCLTLSLICLPLAVADTPDASITPFGNVVQNYTLTWSDEFNGTALDTDKWLYRTDSKMWSTQLPANISIADGHLVIALKKEMVNKKKYTGGGVISKQTFEYGYYEARFKVPPGSGWHTSFWTAFYPPAGNTKKPVHTQEIDICEQDSVRTTTYSAGVLAWDQRGKGYGRKYVKTPDLAKDLNTRPPWSAFSLTENSPTRPMASSATARKTSG
jgi:beta-glucanase (GH16 family)